MLVGGLSATESVTRCGRCRRTLSRRHHGNLDSDAQQVYQETSTTADSRRIHRRLRSRPTLAGVRCADMSPLRQVLFLFSGLCGDSCGRLGNPHSLLLIQLYSAGSNSAAPQRQSSLDVLFCSNMVLIGRWVLEEPSGFSRPAGIMVEVL